MYSTNRIKAAGATLAVGVLLAIALAATAQAGRVTPQGLSAQEAKAVQARADAMNRYYRLGAYSPAALARQAEERRSQATNEFYGLGPNAAGGTSSRFNWTDVGIGAGALLVALLLAGGFTVTQRRRTVGKVSSPTTL
jgi:hypothetical protein